MLDIKIYPDIVLRKTAKAVSNFNDELKQLAQDMGESMLVNNGVGLAANQVNVLKRILVVRDKGSYQVFVNPEITFASKDKKITEEGCLSIPDVFAPVKRPSKIHIKYQDLDGKVHKEKVKDFTTVVLQHEIDHLNGILFTDRAETISQGQEIFDKMKDEQSK